MKTAKIRLLILFPMLHLKQFKITKPTYRFLLLASLFLLIFTGSKAQKLDVPYVPTPDSIVERMLDMANVGPGDYVIDLGSGDGRIVIAAAKRGAIGHGVDLNPVRVKEARENAVKAGVADNVVFVEENIFETDFSRASVIAMYLFPDINVKLRPSLLENLEPGSRIVSHDFDMYEWKPDKKHGRMETHATYLWIVPANVAGSWNGQIADEKIKMTIAQKFQELNLSIWVNNTKLNVEGSLLSGKRISFTLMNPSTLTKYVFSGQVNGDEISGIIQIHEPEKKSFEKLTVIRK